MTKWREGAALIRAVCREQDDHCLRQCAYVLLHSGRERWRHPQPVYTPSYATYVQILMRFCNSPSTLSPFGVHCLERKRGRSWGNGSDRVPPQAHDLFKASQKHPLASRLRLTARSSTPAGHVREVQLGAYHEVNGAFASLWIARSWAQERSKNIISFSCFCYIVDTSRARRFPPNA